jgi:hypothetical protein
MFLYNNKPETILTTLDFIDPIKGKILGIADQEITYKTSFDPAKYNYGTNGNAAIDSNYYWGSAQIGQVWWNLDTIRYINYEQDSLTYRLNNWGRIFPGSSVDVYEWTESDYLPSAYKGEGIPKNIDNSAYVQLTAVDANTGIIKSKYYFWVKGKTTVDTNLPFRKISIESVTNLIKTPAAQNIPYAAAIRNDTAMLINANSYISANNTILHIGFSLVKTQNLVHNEYELIQDNSTATIPTKIISKLIDSITGADAMGNVVPDYKLSAAEKYGISIRPRQTMFINRLAAAQNLVEYVNSVLITTPVVLLFDLTRLSLIESAPTNIILTVSDLAERSYLDTTLLTTGQEVLVLRDSTYDNGWAVYTVQFDKSFVLTRSQGYNTTDYWTKINWFDPAYDSTVKPTHTVETIKDIGALSLKTNEFVYVKNDGSGRFAIYRVNADLTQTLVGAQEATIQLSDALWANGSNQIGLDTDSFDTVRFDLNPTVEFRNIIVALQNDIFIKSLAGHFNKLFFLLLDYIFTEQKSVDWVFKTSYVSIIHNLRRLAQYPNYIQDNQTFYEEYINEVKPYRTQIREYILNYDGSDSIDVHPSDFDLPAYYDTDYKRWRSPSGEYARDEVILSTYPQYADWQANHTFYIDSVQIENSGRGYSVAPKLTVEGGGGIGAVLTATIDYYTGSIFEITVDKPGSGYTSTPTIKVWGDGINTDGQQSLICYPIMRNNTLRSIATTIKFDRYEYSSDIVQWKANTSYNVGTNVSYNEVLYTPITNTPPSTYFDIELFTTISASSLDAADRVAAYYKPAAGMPPADTKQLFVGTEYPGVNVDGIDYKNKNNLAIDSQLESYYTDTLLGTRPEDITTDGGKYVDTYSSHAPEELLPGQMFDTLDIKVFTIRDLANPTLHPMGYRISKPMPYSFINQWQPLTAYIKDDEVSYLGDLYKVKVDFTSGSTFATTWANTTFLLNINWEFHRISASATTALVQPLLILDTQIFVADVTTLPQPSPALNIPGIIYINGEKITYYTIDVSTNSVGQIRRGTWGTGAPAVHISGSLVVDASSDQKLPNDAYTNSWLNQVSVDPATFAVDGLGLVGSITPQATFIKASDSYLPWLPGQ